MGENTYYSDDDFWQKINNYARIAGRKVVEKALQLYYAAADPKTPAWAKSVIWGALMYFIARSMPSLTWFRLQVSPTILASWSVRS